MNIFRLASIAIAAALTTAGCDRAAAPSPQPSTQTAMPAASSAPHEQSASTQRSPAYLIIDGRSVEFPPVRLQVQEKDGQLIARLFSDDPQQALDDGYAGNSFYFEMPLEIHDPAQLGDVLWRFKAPNRLRVDTHDGIFLEGDARQLQPYDVQIDFDKAGSDVAVLLTGQFLAFEGARETNPATALVKGEFVIPAELVRATED